MLNTPKAWNYSYFFLSREYEKSTRNSAGVAPE